MSEGQISTQSGQAISVRCAPTCSKREAMELHGSIVNNLTSAVQSARRLRGHPVHSDTLDHWANLLAHSRHALADGSTEQIQGLIVELENELADRAA